MLGHDQIWRICDTFCLRSGLARRGARWVGPGDGRPTEEAVAFFEGRKGYGCSDGEHVLLSVAFCLFNSRNKVLLGEVVGRLDSDNLRMVGELLVALGADSGETAAAGWLDRWRAPLLAEYAQRRA